MKLFKTTSLFVPLVLFLLFFFISSSGFFEKHTAQMSTSYITDNIFYYSINILAWIFAAIFVNKIIDLLVWGNVSAAFGSKVKLFVVDATSIFVYALAFAGITIFVFDKPFDLSIVSLILIFFITGVVLRRKILSLFKGSFYSSELPYSVGDWIELANHQNVFGKVVNISRKSTKLEDETGRVIIVPSELLFEDVIINHSSSGKEIRVDFSLTFDFSISVDRVKRVINAAIKDVTHISSLNPTNRPEILVREVNDIGIKYLIGIWAEVWSGLTENEIRDIYLTAILKHLNYSGISVAFPKSDIYYNSMPSRNIDIYSANGIEQILSKNDLLSAFSNEEISEIAKNIKVCEIARNEKIIVQGESGDSMFIVIEGVVDVKIRSSNEKEVIVGTLSPGKYFGEMSLLTGDKRSATVTAITDCTLYEINKSALEEIMANRVEIIEIISKKMGDRRAENIQKLDQASHTKESLIKELKNKIKSFFNL